MKKKLLASFMVVVITVATFSMLAMASDDVEGTVTTEKGIKYVPCDISKYWSDEEKVAPTMDNYVFGGWYTATTEGEETVFAALKGASITTDEETGKANVTGTYAKFVSAEVLSVKAQIDAVTEENGYNRSANASLRLISGLDSKDYQKVGFEVLLANSIPVYKDENESPLETTRVYTGLKKSPTSANSIAPSSIFGAQASFLSVWRLDDIIKENDEKIINVTPYWITMDGTKVEGLSKYVHVEDGYMGYISVPINLRTAKQIAAGKLSITYPEGLELVDDKVEYDGVFPATKMACYDDGISRINLVGNTTTVGENVQAYGVFANLRFKAGTSGYTGIESGDILTFVVNAESFCNWSEDEVTVDAWDIKY